MQGTILFSENRRGFIRGADQNQYAFDSSGWLSTTMPVVGQTVDFTPDGTNARHIRVQESMAGATTDQWAEPDAGYLPDQPPAGRLMYNVPGAVAATLLLLSLIPVYGQVGYKTYALTGSGLGGLYYVVALVLIGWVAYGGPWMGAVGLTAASLLCTVLAMLGKTSLFSELSQARRTMAQQTDVLGQLGLEQAGQAAQQAIPGLTDALAPGFYLHVLALMALIYFVLIHPYVVRSGPFTLPTVSGPPAPVQPTTGYQPFVTPAATIPTADDHPTDTPPGPTNGTGAAGEHPFRSSLTVPVPSGEQTRTFFQNFLTFDRMIAPTIITIVYYIALVLCVLGGAFFMLSGLFGKGYGNEGRFTYGLSLLIVGPLMIRLWAEFFIVVFNIHNRLKNLDDKTPGA